MKFSAILIAGLNSAAGEPPKGHLKRLQGLVRGTTEILNSGAFNRKPESWIKMWEQKIITNAERIEKDTIEQMKNVVKEIVNEEISTSKTDMIARIHVAALNN